MKTLLFLFEYKKTAKNIMEEIKTDLNAPSVYAEICSIVGLNASMDMIGLINDANRMYSTEMDFTEIDDADQLIFYSYVLPLGV